MNDVIKQHFNLKNASKKNINRKFLIGLDISQNNLKYWGL